MATDQDPHSELKAQYERDRICYPDAPPLWEHFSYTRNRWVVSDSPGFYQGFDYRRIDHPDYPPIPAPPEGWTLYGMGPLPHCREFPDDWLYHTVPRSRENYDMLAAEGRPPMDAYFRAYSVRTGSPLARKLGIPEPGPATEPEPETPSHPEPPDGWIYYGPGPVPGHEKFHHNPCPDLATYSEVLTSGWDTSPSEGYCPHTVYAVRAGSALARELGLEPAPEPTTIRGWLETLPDGYRERALANCDCPDNRCVNLSDATLSIKWADTPEGVVFWSRVCGWACGWCDLPPLPEPTVNTATEPEIPGALVSRLHAALLSAEPTGDPDMLAARAVAHARALVRALKGGAGE